MDVSFLLFDIIDIFKIIMLFGYFVSVQHILTLEAHMTIYKVHLNAWDLFVHIKYIGIEFI